MKLVLHQHTCKLHALVLHAHYKNHRQTSAPAEWPCAGRVLGNPVALHQMCYLMSVSRIFMMRKTCVPPHRLALALPPPAGASLGPTPALLQASAQCPPLQAALPASPLKQPRPVLFCPVLIHFPQSTLTPQCPSLYLFSVCLSPTTVRQCDFCGCRDLVALAHCSAVAELRK